MLNWRLKYIHSLGFFESNITFFFISLFIMISISVPSSWFSYFSFITSFVLPMSFSTMSYLRSMIWWPFFRSMWTLWFIISFSSSGFRPWFLPILIFWSNRLLVTLIISRGRKEIIISIFSNLLIRLLHLNCILWLLLRFLFKSNLYLIYLNTNLIVIK